jgi:thiamine-monophosphate kinase
MTVPLKEIGEKNLLMKLRRFLGSDSPSVVRIFSEDCAVLHGNPGQYRLFTTDSLLQDIHFRLEYADPYSIGRKAILVNLSDISAMGGTPTFFMLSAGFPEDASAEFVEELYQGMLSVAVENNIAFVGGNITRSPHVILDIFMSGDVAANEVLMRNGAKAGDSVFVNAPLGSSAAGLKCLQAGHRLGKAENSAIEQAIRAHLEPPNHNRLARKIASTKLASSMIDISDGLAGDLAELCRESGTGASLELGKIPIHNAIKELATTMNWDPSELALYGGEDYHLLFTVSVKDRADFLKGMKGETVYEIGSMTQDSGKILADGKNLKSGYEHF